MALPDGITLADLVCTLDNAENYLRMAFGNMHEVRKEHGEVVLRVGRSGTGQKPHYLIDVASLKRVLGEEKVSFLSVASFRGDNHKPYTPEGEEADILRDESWSTGAMTYEEIRTLLGQIREQARQR